MNTIIIPTDFSSVAENAMHYGANLARHINARILLVHIYQIPVTMTDMPVAMISAEELKANSDEMLQKAKEELQANYPGLDVTIENRLGDVNDELNNFINEVNPFAFVTGTDDVSGFERVLFGNTTLSLMRHTSTPVIAVPSGYKYFAATKITLASDLQFSDKFPAGKIIELVQQLGAQLHVVHISGKDEDNAEQLANNLLQKLQPLQPTYTTIYNDNVNEGLFQYLETTPTDLLMLLPHEHNFIERLFFKLHTEDIAVKSPVPVITIKC